MECENKDCDEVYCKVCSGDDDPNIQSCPDCDKVFCLDCRCTEYSARGVDCDGCMELMTNIIPELTTKNKQLEAEVKRLRQENEQLRTEMRT